MSDAKLNVAAAVFADVPAKQKPRSHGLQLSRTVGNSDLERMIRQRTALPILRRIPKSLLSEVGTELVASLVNAGPHVVSIGVELEYDADAEEHKIVVSTPRIPCKTYGPEVKRSDLVIAGRGAEPVVVSSPSLWERLKGWAAEVSKPLVYDGPRGRIDCE